jgi:hypothetical protein
VLQPTAFGAQDRGDFKAFLCYARLQRRLNTSRYELDNIDHLFYIPLMK